MKISNKLKKTIESIDFLEFITKILHGRRIEEK